MSTYVSNSETMSVFIPMLEQELNEVIRVLGRKPRPLPASEILFELELSCTPVHRIADLIAHLRPLLQVYHVRENGETRALYALTRRVQDVLPQLPPEAAETPFRYFMPEGPALDSSLRRQKRRHRFRLFKRRHFFPGLFVAFLILFVWSLLLYSFWKL